jgi:hypothetical protein
MFLNSNRGHNLLQCNEMYTVTGERELADLQRRYQLLHDEYSSVQKQLADKDTKLAQLQSGE